jgi:DNA-binding NtrC family response regulator
MSWKKQIRVLVVEDEAEQRDIVSQIIAADGFQVDAVESAEQALDKLKTITCDIILSDWRLPGESGLQLLKKIKAQGLNSAFVLVTGHGSVEHAIDAIKSGADDYLSKPYKKQTLLFTLQKVCEAQRIKIENLQLKQQLQEQDGLVEMVGKAPVMQKLFHQVERVAGTNATVLIGGESGTGKELAARALHQLSARKAQAFIAVNCAAIPESLAEAEFFGAEKGAYTGADKAKIGKFEAANGGTIFLDEVGELPLSLQAKLLRLLQEGVVTRLGGNKELNLDVRVIAATNRDLQAEAEAGSFREDLYYRLNVIPLVMPPLRERLADIPSLIQHFSGIYSERHQLPCPKFSQAVIDKFMSYSWPGNVRELSNIIERIVLLSDHQQINLEELPEFDSKSSTSNSDFTLPSSGFSWQAHERDLLQQALSIAKQNRAEAARILDLPYKAFLYRLEKYDL